MYYDMGIARAYQALADVKLSQEQQNMVDTRFSRLHGHGGIGRQDRTVFEKGSTMMTADWQHFLQYCDPYAFEGILHDRVAPAYFLLTGIFRLLIDAVCNTDHNDEEAGILVKSMEATIAVALSSFERAWPGVLMSGPVLHTLVHYPRFIRRWNSVRNYWCYFNERCRQTNCTLYSTTAHYTELTANYTQPLHIIRN